jgi:acid phosphatase type 7
MDELRRRGVPRIRLASAALCVALLVAACGHESQRDPVIPTQPSTPTPAPTTPTPTPAPGPPTPTPVAQTEVLVGAGDIALCGPNLANAEATARLLDGISGTVFTAGDNTQTAGTPEEFRDCYEPTWGRHKARTRPTIGNHDYQTAEGAAYYQYFGNAAGPAGAGYYSYNLGAWHIVSLNGNVSMREGSAQAAWLRQDLQANPSGCTLAYWHQPLFSSSTNGSNPASRDAWQILYEHGAEIVLNGHDHLFERFAPQDPSGRRDDARGIRQFTVGTGGCYLYKVEHLQPNSEVQGIAHGVLKLTLREGGYDWQFVPIAGDSFSDSGSGTCHAAMSASVSGQALRLASQRR